MIVCVIGLVVALVRRTKVDLILALFVLAYFIDLMTLQAHFDRYVLPLVPPLGALAGRMRSLAPVTLLLLIVPLTWSVRDTKELTRTDTRVIAQRWVATILVLDSHPGQAHFLRECIAERDAKTLQFPGFAGLNPIRAYDCIKKAELPPDGLVMVTSVRVIVISNPRPLSFHMCGIVIR